MRGNLFSESWFKVADIRVGLLGSVSVQKQYYRGVLWYVLRDSLNNKYYRVTPETWRFLSILTPEKTVEEVWDALLDSRPEETPSQNEVVELLSQLHLNNMLYFRNTPRNDLIFERGSEKTKKEMKEKLTSILWIRIPLWNPDRWLNRAMPFIRTVFSTPGLIVWLTVILLGLKAVAENIQHVFDQSQGILAPSNLIFLYLAVVFLKSFHEMGHAMMNKRFGGPVHTIGIMLLVFTPLPYMDATSSWFFQNRRHRMVVSAIGIMVDLFFAALAAMIWANTGDGLVHGLAFNMMVVGSIATLLFNGNPLLKFDAYYLLTDLLEIPNLYQRSSLQLRFWAGKYLFGIFKLSSPSTTPKEAAWLTLYGIASFFYRFIIMIGIALIVADKFFAAGLALIALYAVTMVFSPLKRFVGWLARSPDLQGKRKRAVMVSLCIAGAVVFLVGICPFFSAARVPGIIESARFAKIHASTEGKLEAVHFKSGASVRKGDVIAKLVNRDLELDRRITDQKLQQVRTLKQKAMSETMADLKTIHAQETALEDRKRFIEEEERKLTIVAGDSGVFISPGIEAFKGVWLNRQAEIGTLIGDGPFIFHGIVSQEKAFRLFEKAQLKAEIRVHGDAGIPIELSDIMIIPYQRENLPSAALGWLGGGDISVSAEDAEGKKAAEPFFEIIGKVVPASGSNAPVLFHGRSGVARLELPPEPIAIQVYRAVKQVIQKRYRI